MTRRDAPVAQIKSNSRRIESRDKIPKSVRSFFDRSVFGIVVSLLFSSHLL